MAAAPVAQRERHRTDGAMVNSPKTVLDLLAPVAQSSTNPISINPEKNSLNLRSVW